MRQILSSRILTRRLVTGVTLLLSILCLSVAFASMGKSTGTNEVTEATDSREPASTLTKKKANQSTESAEISTEPGKNEKETNSPPSAAERMQEMRSLRVSD